MSEDVSEAILEVVEEAKGCGVKRVVTEFVPEKGLASLEHVSALFFVLGLATYCTHYFKTREKDQRSRRRRVFPVPMQGRWQHSPQQSDAIATRMHIPAAKNKSTTCYKWNICSSLAK